MARRQIRPIALLLTDMIMPGMGGAQLAAELRTLQPAIKVIITSGYSDREGRVLDYSDEQTAFLPKPYTPDSLTKAVLAALAHGLKIQTDQADRNKERGAAARAGSQRMSRYRWSLPTAGMLASVEERLAGAARPTATRRSSVGKTNPSRA